MEIFKADRIQGLVRGLVNKLSIGTDDNAPVPRGFRELAAQDLRALLPECESLDLVVAAQQVGNVRCAVGIE
jgi:hypothetical protein